MSIIETLTEGMVNRNMETEGAALLNKWTQTGLLEGLDGAKAQNMAVLLENQAKQLLKESSSMGAGDVAGFAAVAFPIVRRVFAGLIANDLVSVQPMSLPSGLIFFLDFVYSPSLNGSDTQDSRFGNLKNASIYGTNKVGSGVIDGVDLVDARGGDLSQTRGMVGYAYGSPEAVGLAGSVSVTGSATNIGLKAIITLDGALTDAEKKVLQYDPDLLSKTAGTETVVVFDIGAEHFTNPDFDNMSAFALKEIQDGASLAQVQGISEGLKAFLDDNGAITTGAITVLSQVRRLTQHLEDSTSVITSNADAVRFFLVDGAGTYTGDVLNTTANALAATPKALRIEAVRYPAKDTATGAAGDGTIDTFTMLLEGSKDIPEIDIKVDSTAITAQSKKLKAKWTPELGQDLNAYHNIDAEVELTSILSEQIALEIDREILADLVNGATAATYYWSRSPGLFVNRTTGAEIGASSAAPDFTGTVSEWYETLIETINDVSAQIHRKTLRGGATHVVCSPEVANILEFTAGFRANVTADADKGDIGAVKVGSLNRKFDIIVDPYFPRNVLLVGRIGSSFLESGYVYAPYVPLQVTPTIFGVEDFVPRKGVMTRYAKKMVRPDMYGLVIVRGLLGEAGATS
jgi:hypothetical protein